MSTYRGDEVPIADQVDEDLRLRGPSVIESGQHDRPDPDTLNSPEPGSDHVPRPGQKGFNNEGEVRAGEPDRLQHMESAARDLRLSDQERMLYEHHLNNLHNDQSYHHQDGSISTVLAGQFGFDGQTVLLPKVHEGRIIPDDEAVARARVRGIDQYPAYDSPQAATDRYNKIHEYMDRDVRDHVDAMLGRLAGDRQREGGPDRVITEPHSGGTRTRNLDEEQRRQLNDQLNYNDRQGLINQ